MPKREIFDRLDFYYFYIIKPPWLGDFGAKLKKNYLGGSFRSEKFFMRMLSIIFRTNFFEFEPIFCVAFVPFHSPNKVFFNCLLFQVLLKLFRKCVSLRVCPDLYAICWANASGTYAYTLSASISKKTEACTEHMLKELTCTVKKRWSWKLCYSSVVQIARNLMLSVA